MKEVRKAAPKKLSLLTIKDPQNEYSIFLVWGVSTWKNFNKGVHLENFDDESSAREVDRRLIRDLLKSDGYLSI